MAPNPSLFDHAYVLHITPQLLQSLKINLTNSVVFNYAVAASTGECATWLVNSILIHRFCKTALLWYDFALTFAAEVQRIWRRRFSGATIIYLIMRYSMLFQSALFVGSTVLWHSTDKVCAIRTFSPLTYGLILILSVQECAIIQNIVTTLDIVGYLGFSIFTIIRAWAIWDRDWRPLILVAPLALFRPVLSEVSSWPLSAADSPLSCGTISNAGYECINHCSPSRGALWLRSILDNYIR